MSKPFHVIATADENGYTVTIPENPNVSARCADAADIVPTATAAREQDEQNRHEKNRCLSEMRKDIYRLSGNVMGRQQNGNLPGMRNP